MDRGRQRAVEEGDFFRVLARHVEGFQSPSLPRLPPLTAGAVGYVSYDGVRWLEQLPDRHDRVNDLPDAQFWFYDNLVAFDHAKHRLFLIANVRLEAAGSSPGSVEGRL